MSIARAIRANYSDLRGWAIFAQLFLGVGWLRACIAHAVETSWWDGTELTSFVAIHSADSVDAYRPFVEELVLRFPTPISWGVLLLELITGVLLIINIRAEIGLTIGGFLNVQFILAGQVNPSVFYLVAAIALLLWRLEGVATPRTARYHTRRAIALAVLAAIVFGPSIRTFDPALAMEDPALVVIFLAGLVAATTWLTQPQFPVAPVDTDEGESGSKPMVLDLRDPGQATFESTLPLMLSLQRLEDIPSIPRRRRATADIEKNDDDPHGDEQQPRIRDLAPHAVEGGGDNGNDDSRDGNHRPDEGQADDQRQDQERADESHIQVVDIV